MTKMLRLRVHEVIAFAMAEVRSFLFFGGIMKKFDAVVIGAGVVGAFVARKMAEYMKSVAVLEKESDVAMGASSANSAIVHAGFDAKEGSLKARLNVRGSEMMEQVCHELGVKYKKNGSLVAAFSKEALLAVEELYERGVINGVKGLRILSREETLEKESALNESVEGALFAPTGAIVCPYELTVAALGNAMDNGAQLFLDTEVVGIRQEDGMWHVTTTGEEFAAPIVVNCAGIFSDGVAKMKGDDSFEVTSRRGEYLLFDKKAGATVSSTVFTPPTKLGKGILITPTVDGNLLLGPTAENIEDKTDRKTTREGIEKVLSAAGMELKSVPKCVITSFTGLRAVGSTGDFIINEKDGFVNVAGIESPGLSASPAIAEYVLSMILEKTPLVRREDFDPHRSPTHFFKGLSDEEKSEFIMKNPLFAKIICRCEEITEGEIVEAIHTNPPALTVDAVKRRTRATMGRCQGGFCLPHIVEIISRETGVLPEEVTKKGKGSQYVLYKRG